MSAGDVLRNLTTRDPVAHPAEIDQQVVVDIVRNPDRTCSPGAEAPAVATAFLSPGGSNYSYTGVLSQDCGLGCDFPLGQWGLPGVGSGEGGWRSGQPHWQPGNHSRRQPESQLAAGGHGDRADLPGDAIRRH